MLHTVLSVRAFAREMEIPNCRVQFKQSHLKIVALSSNTYALWEVTVNIGNKSEFFSA